MTTVKVQEIRNLIAQGKTEQAIAKAIECGLDGGIQLSARYQALASKERMNLISFSDASTARAQIVNSLLEMLPKGDASSPAPTPAYREEPRPQPQQPARRWNRERFMDQMKSQQSLEGIKSLFQQVCKAVTCLQEFEAQTAEWAADLAKEASSSLYFPDRNQRATWKNNCVAWLENWTKNIATNNIKKWDAMVQGAIRNAQAALQSQSVGEKHKAVQSCIGLVSYLAKDAQFDFVNFVNEIVRTRLQMDQTISEARDVITNALVQAGENANSDTVIAGLKANNPELEWVLDDYKNALDMTIVALVPVLNRASANITAAEEGGKL